MLMIRGIALYLDRTYVKQTTNVRSLWDMGLQLFRKHLSLSSEVEHKTVTGLLRMIESERLDSCFVMIILYVTGGPLFCSVHVFQACMNTLVILAVKYIWSMRATDY